MTPNLGTEVVTLGLLLIVLEICAKSTGKISLVVLNNLSSGIELGTPVLHNASKLGWVPTPG